MHGTTTGEDIFNCVYDLLQKYNLPPSKLTSVATDGATNGFVALLRKKLSEISDGSNIHHTHCIIHQEVLCTKVIKMENVLTPIKKFINFIRSRGLNQRQFSLFLTELESEYSGLSYYTEVRWLSCSKVLKQFWDLKEIICQFLITKNQDITSFSDQVWLQDFSFMVDITKHLSDLNLKLQGKDQIITNMCDQVNAFKCKLVLWEKQLKNEDLMHFPTCNMYKSSLGETASYQKYAEKNLSLRNEFETRFSDFKSLEGKFTLFSSIFSINIKSVPNHMQMEVIDIQCDSDLKAKFIEVGVSEFYKYLPARLENTRKLAYEIMSMFESTYRCEQLFSLMKGNKTPIRSRITDVHLGSVLKLITANKISPELLFLYIVMAPIFGYWNVHALAESIRLLLHHVGEDFEDKRYQFGPNRERTEWLKVKHTLGLDFPNLPYYIDGDIKITQSKAILRYLARKHGLAGKNETEQWKLDMLEQQIVDLAFPVSARAIFYSGKTVEKYSEKYGETAPTNIKLLADYLEDKKWLLGDRLTYVDFQTYDALYCHKVLLPHILDPHSNLQSYVARFEELKGVKEYIASPDFQPPIWSIRKI
ncbi:GTF2IRD2B [Cordylochernes scorpioides]|uniref:GTF2IRD2B n=1 Tax=Cordylochernes scorpioides TaxID=51811 RepID=A0ABY6LKJ9_9ARAC|nr:GTF2IRD2B [Cordylochernes scorpioides]